MRFALILASLILPVCVHAQETPQGEPKPVETKDADKSVTDRSPTMGDAIATPATDLNLKKDAIPALLLTAQDRPYSLSGLRRCVEISAAVSQLDAVLGPDIDLPVDPKTGLTAGRVAQAAVGSFIPFRGLIRELSGANEQERKIQVAIQAGFARRAFLKGVGEARGCRYPARAAGPAEVAALSAQQPQAQPQPTPAVKPSDKAVKYVEQPVVQPIKN